MTTSDEKHIQRALEEAKRSKTEAGKQKKPLVGAVLVGSDGSYIGASHRGEHSPGDHAEYCLLEKSFPNNPQTAGGTLYTTLEPCTSRGLGKTPCSTRIIQNKIHRVVVGMLDPNQNICGRGIRELRDANIEVEFFAPKYMAQAEQLNRIFTAEQISIAPKTVEGAAVRAIARYERILENLDVHFQLSSVVKPKSILIITGQTAACDILDRHLAEMLRDAIEALLSPNENAKPFAIGVDAWSREDFLRPSPTISLGGPHVNNLTKKTIDLAAEQQRKPWNQGASHGVFCRDNDVPRVALWGGRAAETRASVQNYVNSPQGLVEFMRDTVGLSLM